MTHDPLCEVLEDAGFMVAYFGPAGSSDDVMCLSCDLIAQVRADQDRRNAAAELTRDAQDMGMIP